MTMLPPTSRHVLQFSGLDPQVVRQLQAPRMQAEAHSLFQERLDVFVKQDAQNGGSIQMISHKANPKASLYFSGMIRNLNRALTGRDVQPVEQRIPSPAPKLAQHSGDLFIRSTESKN